jgi:cyclophilin family peptidyl-prolyl cis-trans isomerase
MASSKYHNPVHHILVIIASCTNITFIIFYPSNSVVFGSVVEGMDVVKAIESVGSNSGQTKAPVMVAASGQL